MDNDGCCKCQSVELRAHMVRWASLASKGGTVRDLRLTARRSQRSQRSPRFRRYPEIPGCDFRVTQPQPSAAAPSGLPLVVSDFKLLVPNLGRAPFAIGVRCDNLMLEAVRGFVTICSRCSFPFRSSFYCNLLDFCALSFSS